MASLIGTVYAVPQLDPQHAFDYSDIVLVGKVLSVDILSEPKVTKTETTHSEKLGVAIYEIQVEKYFKTTNHEQAITVPGLFTREPHGMSYASYPYEQGQSVLLYLQENTHGYADTDLIIRLGDSQIVDDFSCKADIGLIENCVVNGRSISTSLVNKGMIESTTEHTGEDICGKGTILVDGVCQVIQTDDNRYWKLPMFLQPMLFMQILLPFFVPGSVMFIVLSKTPKFSKTTRLAVCISAIVVMLYFVSGLFQGWYPPVYA